MKKMTYTNEKLTYFSLCCLTTISVFGVMVGRLVLNHAGSEFSIAYFSTCMQKLWILQKIWLERFVPFLGWLISLLLMIASIQSQAGTWLRLLSCAWEVHKSYLLRHETKTWNNIQIYIFFTFIHIIHVVWYAWIFLVVWIELHCIVDI